MRHDHVFVVCIVSMQQDFRIIITGPIANIKLRIIIVMEGGDIKYICGIIMSNAGLRAVWYIKCTRTSRTCSRVSTFYKPCSLSAYVLTNQGSIHQAGEIEGASTPNSPASTLKR